MTFYGLAALGCLYLAWCLEAEGAIMRMRMQAGLVVAAGILAMAGLIVMIARVMTT
jgi:hypothetical protein